MNKKIIIIVLALIIVIGGIVALIMFGKSNAVDMTCVAGNVISVPDNELNLLESVQWISDDPSIIDVIDGKPVGVSVGVASIAAMNGDKKIKEYRIEITASPIESIKMRSESNAYVGVPTEIRYIVTPEEAIGNGVIIRTDNENVAIVEDGNIVGVSAGEVNLIFSNGSGYENSYKINVIDSPYALLSVFEKEFVDSFKKFRTYYWFDDPENLKLLAIQKLEDGWAVNYQKSDGEEETMLYGNSDGSVKWLDGLYAEHSSLYNLEKISKALDEVYIDTRK